MKEDSQLERGSVSDAEKSCINGKVPLNLS